MALSGMTGFARAEGAHGAWSWTVEARSVNGRSLEVRFRGPPGFEGLEKAAREAAQGLFQRGQVGVTLTARRAESRARVRVDEGAVTALLAAAEPFLASGVVRKPTWDGLLAVRGVVEAAEAEDAPEDRTAVETAMAASLAQALQALRASRGEEGAALARVLCGHVARIEALVADASHHAAEQGPALRERFRGRLAELLAGVAFSEERMLAEAAALAAKADVREELDRLTAHVAAARALLAGEGASGRRLDFLTQEFMREANTLCAKSASIALTQVGLELKTVIDQVREQVQNVE
jgi:uncharacterized protein (TIGR00255 family)